MTDSEARFRRRVLLVLCALAFVVGISGLSILGHNRPPPALPYGNTSAGTGSAATGVPTPCLSSESQNFLAGAVDKVTKTRKQLRSGGDADKALDSAQQQIEQATQVTEPCPVPPPELAPP